MAANQLLHSTSQHFPHFAEKETSIHPLEKGGSQRKFYRLSLPGGDSMIAVVYLPEKVENTRYADIAEFLATHGVRVPRIFQHDREACILWMEDFGATDLWSYRQEPWSILEKHYHSALDQAWKLHHHASRHMEEAPELEPPFDQKLYRWEQEYFAEHFLGGILRVPESEWQALLNDPGLLDLTTGLAAHDRALVHRDFQSQNILIHRNEAGLIDFQGMRAGLPEYDLASLLCDPYVNLAPEQRDALLSYYIQISGRNPEEVTALFWRCGAQRLMQALGAYGFLGLTRGRPEFLAHVAPARILLKEASRQVPEITCLQPHLAHA